MSVRNIVKIETIKKCVKDKKPRHYLSSWFIKAEPHLSMYTVLDHDQLYFDLNENSVSLLQITNLLCCCYTQHLAKS